MFNNKGQSLVLFILILPILLGIMVLVVDMGNVFCKKNEIDSTLEFVLDYGLAMVQKDNEIEVDIADESNLDANDGENVLLQDDKSEKEIIDGVLDQMEILLQYNLEECQNEIRMEDEKIVLSSRMYVEGIFSNILGFRGFLIESEYYGYLDGDQKRMEKVK